MFSWWAERSRRTIMWLFSTWDPISTSVFFNYFYFAFDPCILHMRSLIWIFSWRTCPIVHVLTLQRASLQAYALLSDSNFILYFNSILSVPQSDCASERETPFAARTVNLTVCAECVCHKLHYFTLWLRCASYFFPFKPFVSLSVVLLHFVPGVYFNH